MQFVERTNEGRTQIVVLRFAALFYWLLWPTVAITAIASTISSPVLNGLMAITWVALVASAIPYFPVTVQLKNRMRDGAITVSGSKYSFSNPLTYRWTAS